MCFYLHVRQSQDPLYRKSDPELDVERTLAHFPHVSTQKIKMDRNEASSLDSWLSWPFCPEQVPKGHVGKRALWGLFRSYPQWDAISKIQTVGNSVKQMIWFLQKCFKGKTGMEGKPML